jgi:N-acetylmuramoyl-L-alanine amidase
VAVLLVAGVAALAAVRLGGTPHPAAGHHASPLAHSGDARTSPPASVSRSPAAPRTSTPTARAAAPARPARPLAGKVVGIDPGHNGGNGADPAYINQMIWNGRESETCDTTGTATDSGYTEAQFNYDVARYLGADLRRAGARVVLTRTSNDGVGPCVNRRAAILNDAHSNVAIDIHADGGPSWGRGFSILEPVADGPNDKVIGASLRFADEVRTTMLRQTTMPVSNYYGQNGFEPRSDLAGLNLTTVPKILVECGNMRNAADARLLTSAAFQKQLAAAFTSAIIRFLTSR